jgi:protocatechuate 3,4-dioxygenase alpha subunit
MPPAPTPPQTIGPFFHVGLRLPRTEQAAGAESADGRLVRIRGRVLDGAGAPVSDALVEAWDAPGGRFGRCATDAEGRYEVLVVKPASPEASAPHLTLWVFARGLLDHLVTRVYFPDEAANAADPVLGLIPDPETRATLIAREEAGGLRFDIRLQGERETVFFAL